MSAREQRKMGGWRPAFAPPFAAARFLIRVLLLLGPALPSCPPTLAWQPPAAFSEVVAVRMVLVPVSVSAK
jgi:hypothetical protein